MSAAASAPATPERSLIHFASKKITELQNLPPEQLRLFVRFGKPPGFWYAYGEDWLRFVKSGRAGRSNISLALRYEFSLPEEAFTKDVASATPDTILELSAANLDAFMERFARAEYRHSRDEMIGRAFEVLIKDGASAVLDELAEADASGEFAEFLEEVSARDLDKLVKKAYKKFPELFEGFAPSRRALNRNYTVNYNWRTFWRDVADAIGGIEFQEDLFEIQEWRGIWLSWSNKLDIRSGVIFHPAAFRGGVLLDKILAVDPTTSGGRRRRTRRLAKRRSRKN